MSARLAFAAWIILLGLSARAESPIEELLREAGPEHAFSASAVRRGPAEDLTYFCALSGDQASSGLMLFQPAPPPAASIRGETSSGIPISATAEVSAQAVAKAADMLARMLSQSPRTIPASLAAHRVVLAIIPKNAKLTDLPQFAKLRGVKLPGGRLTWDSMRGIGFHAQKDGSIALAVGEENLLLDGGWDSYPKGYLVAHEFSHAVHGFGVGDARMREIARRYHGRKKKKDPFPSRHAERSEYEYFAVSAGLLFGFQYGGPEPEQSWSWLLRHDGPMAGIVQAVYGPPRPLWEP